MFKINLNLKLKTLTQWRKYILFAYVKSKGYAYLRTYMLHVRFDLYWPRCRDNLNDSTYYNYEW